MNGRHVVSLSPRTILSVQDSGDEAFFVLTLLGVCQLIISAIPFELYSAVAAGVGLFIALIGFRNSGIIAPSPATTVTLGNLRAPATALAIFGLLFIAALLAWRVRAAMVIGILTTTLIGLSIGVAKWSPQPYHLTDLSATAGKLDIHSTLRFGFLEIVCVFLFITENRAGKLLAAEVKDAAAEMREELQRDIETSRVSAREIL